MTPHLAADFSVTPALAREIAAWRTRFLAAGVLALVASLIGAIFTPDAFLRAWLWSYTLYIGITVGCLALLMLQFLTGGAWGVVIRRICEAAARTLPLLALLFLPIALGIPRIYEWSDPGKVKVDQILQHKHIYLNTPFFLVRTVLYFAGWGLCAWLIDRWSREQDETGSPLAQRKMEKISAGGLVFYGFSVTFMAIDWLLSLNPHWFSTMFGLLFIAAQCLSALAFVIALLILLSARPPLSEIVTPRHLHDLGKLLLTFVMLWAYMSFSQFLIIWSGNLPHEITFYLARLSGGWQYVALVLVLLHFAFPFALLLSRDIKRDYRLLRWVALLILAVRFVDLYWLVAPEYHRGRFFLSWLDLAVPIALGGLWLAFFAWQLPRRPLLPVRDPHLEEALEHGRE
jgi:hypothetical protein